MKGEKKLAQAEVFSKILYSQVWEDPDLHKIALRIKNTDVVFAICSAGDNVFAHLLDNPAKIYAVDFNPAQVALARLKAEGIKQLEIEDFLGFIGVRESVSRLKIYEMLRPGLTDIDQKFWDQHLHIIEKGIIHSGRFESYFHKFQKYVLPLVHSKKTIIKLFEKKTLEEQRNFYHNVWDNWRSRLLFRIFFSKPVMAKLGRSKEQFVNVKGNDIAQQFLDRARLALCDLPAHENYFLQYIILSRHLYPAHFHPYLLKRNYEIIKRRLHRISFHVAAAGDFMDNLPDKSIDAWNLSDIFEYLNEEDFMTLGKKIARTSADRARLSYWNFLTNRKLSNILDGSFSHDAALSQNLWMQDKAFVYGDYVVEQVKR